MYLQLTKAAEILGLSRQWLYELIARGEIGVTEIAGRRVVVEDARFRALKKRYNGRNGK